MNTKADTCLSLLPEVLINETGMPGVGVCIWRKDTDGPSTQKITVGEFLSKKENQSGTWLIDGGWGGPPGPIHVRWNSESMKWENGGFLGSRKNENS